MKKIISGIAAMIFAANSFTAAAVDWGGILREREVMVNTPDYEVYVEGPVESAPYYGAKFEPRGGTYFGCVAENRSEFTVNPGANLTYIENSSQTDFYYPANDIIRNTDDITVVEYIATSFDAFNINSFAATMQNINSYNKPMIVTIMNEMNTNNLQYDAQRYVSLFRQAADIAHKYPNIAVAWSPVDLGSLDKPYSMFYPGDEYVDWISLSSYNLYNFAGKANTTYNESVYFMTGQYAWATNKVKLLMKFLDEKGIQKPVMIAQAGIANSTKVNGNIDWWTGPRIRNMYYDLIMKYPKIKLINYFNTTLRATENETFSLSGKPHLARIIDDAVSSGAYIDTYGGRPRFVYKRWNTGCGIKLENGYFNAYLQAYVPGRLTNEVSYYIDGKWYHCTNTAPYKCAVYAGNLSDGEHKLTISLNGSRKTYTFYKTGNDISVW